MLGQHSRATLLLDERLLKILTKVDSTFGQCTPATCFNMTEFRWVHCFGPTLDQHTRVRLLLEVWKFVENTKLTQLWPMYSGDLF